MCPILTLESQPVTCSSVLKKAGDYSWPLLEGLFLARDTVDGLPHNVPLHRALFVWDF